MGSVRPSGQVSRPFFVFVLLLAVGALACSRSAGALEIALEVDDASGGVIRLTGLSSEEVSSLETENWDETAWQAFLVVHVAGTEPDRPAVLGRYTLDGAGVIFRPQFGFDAGRQYIVTVDPARLPLPREEPPMATGVSLPAIERSPTTTVTEVRPTGSVWPENMLRIYIEFSAPMSRTSGLDFVRLVDESGREVVDPFLPLDVEFWSRDYTRYTLFFDPGRVKREILPNRQMGRALEAGRRYVLEVDASWPDANGQPLVGPYRKAFESGPPDLEPIDTATWQVIVPAAGTRDPLAVLFPKPLDHGLLLRALGVSRAEGAAVEGEVEVVREEGAWRFTPSTRWTAGAYDLIVLSILEDPAGNRVGRPFEVDQFDRIDEAGEPKRTTVPFRIR